MKANESVSLHQDFSMSLFIREAEWPQDEQEIQNRKKIAEERKLKQDAEAKKTKRRVDEDNDDNEPPTKKKRASKRLSQVSGSRSQI